MLEGLLGQLPIRIHGLCLSTPCMQAHIIKLFSIWLWTGPGSQPCPGPSACCPRSGSPGGAARGARGAGAPWGALGGAVGALREARGAPSTATTSPGTARWVASLAAEGVWLNTCAGWMWAVCMHGRCLTDFLCIASCQNTASCAYMCVRVHVRVWAYRCVVACAVRVCAYAREHMSVCQSVCIQLWASTCHSVCRQAHMPAVVPRTTSTFLDRQVCDALTLASAPLCGPCSADPALAAAVLTARVGRLERAAAQLARICQHCGGGGGLGLGGIACDSLDCGLYFERQKTRRELAAAVSLQASGLDMFGEQR